MRQQSERVYGPYHEPDRNRWRVVIHRADGERTSIFAESEAEAHTIANAARGATETRTLSQAVGSYVESIPEKGRETARMRLEALLRLPDEDRLLRALNERAAERLYKLRRETTFSVWVCACGEKGCMRRGGQHPKSRTERPLADATHLAELSLARRMFKWCIEQGWIRENPFASVKGIGTPSRGKPKLRVNPSRAFMAHLLRDSSVEATAVMCAFMLGLRASAVVNRRVEDLDDDGWLLWVRDNKTAAGDLEIEIPGVLRERLLAICSGRAPADRMFGEVDRHWLHRNTVRLCREAGVPRVTPHGLRGSAVTNAVRMGGSLSQVAEAAGHADAHSGADTLKSHYLGGGALESARARAMVKLTEGIDDGAN